MRRVVFAVLLLFGVSLAAQSTPVSDPTAITLAQQAIAAVNRGNVISDVTLNASVISILGSDSETGTGTFRATLSGLSRVDLNLSGGTRADVRNFVNGSPTGAWSKNGNPSTPYVTHNCWTDAAWFFPVLSSVSQIGSKRFVFKYIGQEQHGGVNTQHIQIFQVGQQFPSAALQHLSSVDVYLDVASSLPLAVATTTHPDNDMNADLPVEVRFTNYQPVSGIMVPFHFQQMLNGGVVLDVTVTSATFNSGLPASLFVLP